MAAYTEFFPLIEEEWVLIIDLDEFLYLNSTGNIKTLLSSIGDCVGQVQFPWLNLFSNKYHEDSTFGIVSQSRKYASNHVKANHYHDRFVLDLSYYQQHAFILHFFSRGHFDILNRITGHKFFNGNCGDPEKVRLRQLLTGRPSWRNLPNRYFLMKVLQELPQVEVEINLPELGATTDADMLHDIFRKTVRTTVDFVGGDRSDMQREFENQFLLDHKLASFNLDGKVDLEGFFE